MVRRVLFTAVGVVATLALFMGPAAATSEPVTKITFTLDAPSVPAGTDITGLVSVTTGSGKAEKPFVGATLTVSIDGVTVGSTVTNGAGVAAVIASATAPGGHTIRVCFAGDADHKKAHKDLWFVVTPGTPTSSTTVPEPTTTTTTTTTVPEPTTTTTTTTVPEPTMTTTTTTATTDPTTTTTEPPPGQAPDAPVIYIAEAPAPGLVYLEWTTPADNGSAITGFNVYRRAPGGTMDLLLHKGPSAFSADDTHVTVGVTYAYVVTAVNGVGESVWSNEVSVTAI